MMPPLLSSAANALLEAQVRAIFQLDPFWRERLAQLDGLRLKLVLTDTGFKRIVQFGPSNLHLAAPFGETDVTLTTQTLHLPKLLDVQQTTQALNDSYFYVQGDEAAFTQIVSVLRQFDLDWEAKLAEILPDFAAFQIQAITELTGKGLLQGLQGLKDSYAFWRDNEFHRSSPRSDAR
jgi:ubiquinone biosynthesis protein UbiJ